MSFCRDAHILSGYLSAHVFVLLSTFVFLFVFALPMYSFITSSLNPEDTSPISACLSYSARFCCPFLPPFTSLLSSCRSASRSARPSPSCAKVRTSRKTTLMRFMPLLWAKWHAFSNVQKARTASSLRRACSSSKQQQGDRPDFGSAQRHTGGERERERERDTFYYMRHFFNNCSYLMLLVCSSILCYNFIYLSTVSCQSTQIEISS